MAPEQPRKRMRKPKAAGRALSPVDHALKNLQVLDEGEDQKMEKDATEGELERKLFGDSKGFKDEIRDFQQNRVGYELAVAGDGESAEEEDEAEEGGLEHVEDADLYFLDSGPDVMPSQAHVPAPTSDDDGFPAHEGEVPAWEDSDDERMMVSLASVPRLRKLRRTEEEDVINGKEYAKRLRKQFERLYPVPEWANPSATGKLRRKRRRGSEAADSSAEESASAEDMDVDDNPLAVQPLAKLLHDADGLSRRANNPHKRRKLRPEVIDIQRMKDIGSMQPSAITSLDIHPSLPLLLSSGPSSTLYLHHINPHPPNPNPLLTSLHMKRTPLTTTAFHPSPSDSRIFLSARRRFFHIWNLNNGTIEKVARVYGHQHEQRSMERFSLSPDGKYMALLGSARKGGGVVNFLDAKTLQWVSQARVESRGGIADLAWWSDGNGLCIVGKNGEVTEWSMKEQRTLARWTDEGAVGTTTLALGGKSGMGGWLGGDRWVAVGSSSGIVNIYDRRAWVGVRNSRTTADGERSSNHDGIPTHPSPTRTLDQLTMPTSHLVFSPDGQVLAMASRWKKDALRLVHLPSCTVYRNWPTAGTPLGKITAVAWGRGDGEANELMLVVANEQGRIRLWEVRA